MTYDGKPAVCPPGSNCCLLRSWYFSTCLPVNCQGCGEFWGDTERGGGLSCKQVLEGSGKFGRRVGRGGAVLRDCRSCRD